jgi:transposase
VFDATRFVWNHTLGRWSDLWRHERERLLYGDASAELTDLRHTFEWLARQPHVPQQQTLRALYRSISAFFDAKNPARRPKFRRRGTHRTAEWTKNGFKVTGTGLGGSGERLSVATSSGRVCLRVVWSRPLFDCEICGLVIDRDRNAARNLNPRRSGCSYRVSTGDDGHKTSDPAGDLAA